MSAKRLLVRLLEVIRSAANMHRLSGMIYVAIRNRARVRPSKVLLESRSGIEFIGNPYYLAKLILEDTSYSGLTVVIAGASRDLSQRDVAFSGACLHFCRRDSIRYAYHLATAAFLVNDEVFPDYFTRRASQQYLNTVGVFPMEAIHTQTALDSLPQLSNRQRNFLQATHLLSVNQEIEALLLDRFMLRGLWTGRFIRASNPSCDSLKGATDQAQDSDRSADDLCAQFLRGEDRLPTFTPRETDEKPKMVLIFAGSMLNNGITASLKSFIQLADLERINIVLWLDADAAEQNAGDYIRKLPSPISYVVSRFSLVAGPLEAIRLLWREFTGRPPKFGDALDLAVWQREWNRHLGTARVPCFVHFTGYDRRASYLLSVAAARKVMYVHNEMAEEIHKKGLDARALSAAYDAADVIAVVREGLDEKYNRQFHSIAAKTLFVPNPLILNCKTMSRDDPARSLAECTPAGEIRRLEQLLQEPGAHRFINVARFSPEKGQESLIEAFEHAWQEHPECQLIILGGYGSAFNQVRARGRRSDAADRIFIGMGSTNPFPLMARADAFVLASQYEGQPVVVYEALALGLPVISTDIPGPAEVLREGHGLVVENSVAGLTHGLLSSVTDDVPQRPYDFMEHNREAMARFYAVVDA